MYKEDNEFLRIFSDLGLEDSTKTAAALINSPKPIKKEATVDPELQKAGAILDSFLSKFAADEMDDKQEMDEPRESAPAPMAPQPGGAAAQAAPAGDEEADLKAFVLSVKERLDNNEPIDPAEQELYNKIVAGERGEAKLGHLVTKIAANNWTNLVNEISSPAFRKQAAYEAAENNVYSQIATDVAIATAREKVAMEVESDFWLKLATQAPNTYLKALVVLNKMAAGNQNFANEGPHVEGNSAVSDIASKQIDDKSGAPITEEQIANIGDDKEIQAFVEEKTQLDGVEAKIKNAAAYILKQQDLVDARRAKLAAKIR